MKKKKKTPLSPEDKDFIKEVIHTGSLGQAVLNSYPANNNREVKSIINNNLKNPSILKAISKSIDLDNELLYARHVDLLNKTVKHTYFDKESQQLITTDTEEIDVNAVSKGLDMAYKLKGLYAPEEKRNINVNIEARSKGHKGIDKLTKRYEEDLKAMFSQEKPNDTTTDSTIPQGDINENA